MIIPASYRKGVVKKRGNHVTIVSYSHAVIPVSRQRQY